jgi:glutamine amidotransferase
MGICLGMQLLCRSSDEEGIITDGLGIVDADVRRFSSGAIVPHMGYNQVSSLDAGRLYEGIDDHSDFYFVHSHRVESCAEGLAGLCDYDQGFVASYEVNGVFGVQFHPELSQGPGLKLISNFLKLV